jgi:eukaryotic translation initiation factor 2C
MGAKGRQIQVRANFFEFLTLPGKDIFHYEVRIIPEVPPSLNRRIFREAQGTLVEDVVKATLLVFDGRKNLYSPFKLSLTGEDESFEADVILAEDDRPGETRPPSSEQLPRKFNVRVRHVAAVSMENLGKFLTGKLDFTPYDVLQAVDILLRQRPSMSLTTVGRSFFTRNDSKVLGDGAECWMGFHQSVRPAQGKLLVNVDISATAFYEPGPILNFVARNLGRRMPSELKSPLKQRDVDKCERLLKGVKVVVTHRGEMRRKYKIASLTRSPADETYFMHSRKSEGGQTVEKEITVADYFQLQYNFQLRFPHLPCLKVGSPQRVVYLPLEVCDIIPGQRYLRKLNEQQTAQMIRLTCQAPDRRAQKISQAMNELGHQTDNDEAFLAEYGVRLADRMVTVPARILEPPTIQYHPTSREPLITPREGSWNLRDKKVVQPATLYAWSVVCFGTPRDMPQQKVDHFLRELIMTCRDTGLIISNPHPPAIYGDPSGNIEGVLQTAWQAAGEAVQSYPQLILCVLPNTAVPLYAEIKRIGDTVLGIPTQCVQAKHTFQPKKQYCANVCLKINSKLGGINSFIVRNPSVVGDDGLPWVAQEPTMIFGADVTHPAHGEVRATGSVCALVGSLDRLAR